MKSVRHSMQMLLVDATVHDVHHEDGDLLITSINTHTYEFFYE